MLRILLYIHIQLDTGVAAFLTNCPSLEELKNFSSESWSSLKNNDKGKLCQSGMGSTLQIWFKSIRDRLR